MLSRDENLGGSREVAINEVKLVQEKVSNKCLLFNIRKSDFICSDHATKGIASSALPGLRVVHSDHEELLGSPLGQSNTVAACANELIKIFDMKGNRLRFLHSHDLIALLYHSFAIPKML